MLFRSPNFGAPPGASPVKVEDHGFSWLVLRLLRDEILAADPAADVPTVEEIAAADGGLETPAVRALLVRLEVAAKKAGVDFPKSLAVE